MAKITIAPANRHASASACFGHNATALLPHCANTSARRLTAPALTNIGERGLNVSGKLFEAEEIRNNKIKGSDRFIRYAVNVRFFTIQGSEDMLVDTLGMGFLYLPDLQYHFHNLNPNSVVNHAYNVASYLLSSGNEIKSGETIDGVTDGLMDRSVRWKCQYEDALIQPNRSVLDINTGIHASGNRE